MAKKKVVEKAIEPEKHISAVYVADLESTAKKLQAARLEAIALLEKSGPTFPIKKGDRPEIGKALAILKAALTEA